ncbi:8163_t:CDS:2, partial [Acaulospora morrowiae]
RMATTSCCYPVGMSLDMRIHCLPPTCCFPVYHMFELIINEYLGNTMCKDWTIIDMLEYVESKSEISTDLIETLKTEIYSTLQNFRDTHNIHIHENAKNKALINERRGFHLAVRRNVTSSNTLQALEGKEIEEIRNTNENEVSISVNDESGQGNEKGVTQE